MKNYKMIKNTVLAVCTLFAATGSALYAGDAPNPWFGKAFSQDLDFVSLGGENGREILKTPDGKQVCVAHFQGKNVVRFGHVDGTYCRIGAWGPQAISLSSGHAKLVHVKKTGKWMSVAEAEKKQLIDNGKALIKNESSPSFIPGKNNGGSYFPAHHTTWFAKMENGQWHEKSNPDKNKIQIYVTNLVEGATPNPWFGKAYTDKMTLIKLGEEKGRKILKTPEGKKVCAAHFVPHNKVRFGFVDGNDCRIGAWGAQAISLNSSYARLVHVKDGGSWMSVTDATNKGYASGENMMIKGTSSPAFEPGKNATGGYYIKHNGLWFARNEGDNWHERNFMDKNIIQMFVPGVGAPGAKVDAPNPWFGKAFSQDLDFVALGGEKGREILKTPEGKQVCVAYFKEKKVVRFGHADGTNCRIGAWGPQAISLNSDHAKLVHVKKPGKWMTVRDAETKQLIDNGKALIKNESSPSFIPGENNGGSYFPAHHTTWFAKMENGQWHERSNNGKEKIQIYVTNLVEGATPNPWFGKAYSDKMTLIKLGTEDGREILKTPEGKKVCAAHFVPHNKVRFGFVDGNDCRIGAWGPQAISLNSSYARLVHVKDGGTWMSVTDATNKGYISDDNMMLKGASSPAFEPGKNATGGFYIKHNGLWFARNENGQWHERSFKDKNIIQMFVPGVGAPSRKRPRAESTADAPNPLHGVEFQHVDFVRPGGENGRAILTAPDTQNQVCVVAYNLGLLKGPGEPQMPFGYVLDVNGKKSCRVEAWGIHDYAFDDHPQNVFLVHAKTKGSWKPIKEMQANDWNEMVVAKASGSNKYNNGIASFNGIPGKTHMKHHKYYGGSGDANNKGPVASDHENVRIYMPTQEVAAATPDEAPNPWFGKAYSDKMTLIKLGAEKGRDILTNPDGKKVCAAHFAPQKKVRFGFVDGTDCRIGAWGAQAFSLNSADARLVHVKDGGAWMSVTDATNKGHISDDKMMVKGASSPAFEPGKNATGGFYIKHNGLWFARNENGQWHERSFKDKNIIQMFVPGVGAPSRKRPRAESTADAPNPLHGVEFQHVDLVRPGGENGRAILTAPDTQNQVCVVAYNLGSLKGPGEPQMPFGSVLDVNGKKSCRIEAWGVHDYAFDDHPENVFLVHAKTKGSWKPIKEMQANDWNEMVVAKASGSNKYNNGIASFNGIPGKTHMKHHKYYGGSGDANNKGPVVGDHENVRIYMPTQEIAADTKATATSDKSSAETPNPWFGEAYSQDMKLVKLGAENGLEILKAPDGKQVCLAKAVYNNKDYVRFGYVDGTTCNMTVAGAHAVDLNGDEARLVHISKGGSWLTLNDAKTKGHIVADKMLMTSEQSTPGYSKDAGTGAYYIIHKGLWYAKDNQELNILEASGADKIEVFVPGAVEGEPAAKKQKVESSTADAPSTVEMPTEADPRVTQTAQAPMTEDQVLTAISEGRVVVEDPDVAMLLESQKPISLDGESFKWVEFGKGFALQPVSLSPTSGVICRLFATNNQAYIGNVYKNNRTTTPDIALSEIKVGDFVCRAGTDLQGNKVHITSKFQTLGNRGENILWAPMTSTQATMWETGYKAINAGADITEGGKTFKASGVCRLRKQTDPTKFHIGRAVVDQNNALHCYLKAKGVETDITGERLQSVEVLIRPSLAQTPAPIVPGQAPQQGVQGQAPQQGVPGQAPQQGVPGQAPAQTFFG